VDALPGLEDIRQRILVAISEKGEVRDQASGRLAGLRRELQQARNEIEKRLSELVNTQTDVFQDRFFTLRNDRYVVPVKSSSQSLVQGIIHDQSGSGQTVFVEPMEFLPMNNRLVRLRSEEREEVMRILCELTALLTASLADLTEIFDTLVFFDVLNAKARFIDRFGAKRPEIATDGHIELFDARHPLLHPECVPMDIALDSSRSCLIVTGPNGGGKTVAMKTVGVNALLMQAGCYILASDRSRLPIFREILVDIGESQSIEDHLSTFTSHLKRLKEILDTCDRDCLVLIDEIGTGTDPEEGAMLAYGVLQEIRGRGALAVVSSHYEALKQLAFTTPGFCNAAMEFDYKTFRPTFKFMMGVPGRSNALAIARLFGLPESVLGEMVKSREGKGFRERELLEALETERSRIETMRQTWEEKIRVVEFKELEADELLAHMKEFRRRRRDEVSEAYEGRFKAALKEIENVIAKLKSSATAGDGHSGRSRAAVGGGHSGEFFPKSAGRLPQPGFRSGEPPKSAAGQTLSLVGEDQGEGAQVSTGASNSGDLAQARAALASIREAIADLTTPQEETPDPITDSEQEPVGAGSTVVWGRVLQQGIVQEVDFGRNRAIVDFDGKRLTVPLSELRHAEMAIGKLPAQSGVGIILTSTSVVSENLDLRGLRVEEALEKAEAFLKLAQAQGLGRVFLIHGKGTGALQRAVQDFLKQSPWRNRFRPGRYGEGDLGVTVVVFDPSADKAPEGYDTSTGSEMRGRPRRKKGSSDSD